MSNTYTSALDESGTDAVQLASQTLGSQEKAFKTWFQEYAEAEAHDLFKDSDVIQSVAADNLDADFVEKRIRESAATDLVINGFCSKCQHLLDNWITLGNSSTRNHDSDPDPDEDGWETAVARSCSTFELEASARAKCRFCTFILQCLKDEELLDTYRKIEARLHHLDDNSTASLSIQNWGTSPIQLLWLNLPGKICTSCNSGMALECNFESSFLPASGASWCCNIVAEAC
jgi:hypothetical protein